MNIKKKEEEEEEGKEKSKHLCLLLRSSPLEVFLEQGLLKICSKFTGEQPCQSVISIKLLCFPTLLKSHFGMGVLL